MSNKQTAVEYFYDGLFKHVKASSLHSSNDVINDEWIISKYRIIELFKFCQQMEKEQIKDAFKSNNYGLEFDKWAEQYYNETYENHGNKS
jgi:hypothetical protein